MFRIVFGMLMVLVTCGYTQPARVFVTKTPPYKETTLGQLSAGTIYEDPFQNLYLVVVPFGTQYNDPATITDWSTFPPTDIPNPGRVWVPIHVDLPRVAGVVYVVDLQRWTLHTRLESEWARPVASSSISVRVHSEPLENAIPVPPK